MKLFSSPFPQGNRIISILVFLFITVTLGGQEKVQVTILGVHHFHNPGADMFNIHQDNIKSPRRQKEVLDLVEDLIAFRPSKVLIEKVYGDTMQQHLYEAFLKHRDETKLSENEKEQVGFRVAMRLNHSNIYPFDYRQGMNLQELEKLAQTKPEVAKEFRGMMEEMGTFIQSVNDTLQLSTVKEFLVYMNLQESVDLNHQIYLRMLRMTGEDSYGASEAVSAWYGRNIRMFYNLNRITDFDKSQERILIIVGQGHKAILQDLIEDAPYYEYVDILDFIGEN